MKKIAFMLSLLALSFTACSETESLEPARPSSQVPTVDESLTVDFVIHSQTPAQINYSYAGQEGKVTLGEPKTLKVLPDSKIWLSANGATFYCDGKKLDSNYATVTSNCQIMAVFEYNNGIRD
jgi:hypothetical protein